MHLIRNWFQQGSKKEVGLNFNGKWVDRDSKAEEYDKAINDSAIITIMISSGRKIEIYAPFCKKKKTKRLKNIP